MVPFSSQDCLQIIAEYSLYLWRSNLNEMFLSQYD